MNHDEVMQVLNDPLAQELMHSQPFARLAYIGTDGAPRAVPVSFYWNGAQFVTATAPKAPKVCALQANPKIALTVDTNTRPPHALLVRGTATVEEVDGVPMEQLKAFEKQMPAEQLPAHEIQMRAIYKQMARIRISPEWAKLLDYETRWPSCVEKLMKEI